jgi:hypothetical protein
MLAKAIAKCFWNRETELELDIHGLREEWLFKAEKDGPLTGNVNDVMEHVDKRRCGEFCAHKCSAVKRKVINSL